ncbi:MAG: alanine--tRNA ligase [Planctomycetota bacterium]|jgi:alanyl-tRNA synthetase|nr:alanine--tRNA ligase [Planctomycetota bacterium]
MKTACEIRQEYIEFFTRKYDHVFVPSSPVVPHDDPTLLFANAGMNQFKEVFQGVGNRSYSRAVNTQKCIRAGGKHNDLEDVGRDTYHHTFFEMLGNWSFGDYFKREAISWAWELLTEVWGIPVERLHATVFAGDEKDGIPADEEAESLWFEVAGIPPERVHRFGKKDNFWEMGDVGPCGPCSEIHIDLTPDLSGGALVNADDPRVIELWNLVFIQFDRDESGQLHRLPAQHVDTGMGFERVTAVLQGKESNYDTDIFSPIFARIAELSGVRPYGGDLTDSLDVAYRVLADHVRTLSFAIADGAQPGNEGRDYVLRRILRRAARFSWQELGQTEPFLCRIVPTVIETMSDAFPELAENPKRLVQVVEDEERAFLKTLGRGIGLFEEALEGSQTGSLSGEDAFKLHDTYGFPIDLTEQMAQEKGVRVDLDGYRRCLSAAQEISRAAGVGGEDKATLALGGAQVDGLVKAGVAPTEDEAKYRYEQGPVEARVVALWDGQTLRSSDGDSCLAGTTSVLGVVLDRTGFYAESGGQIGDHGWIEDSRLRFEVHSCRAAGGYVLHVGTLTSGSVEVGQPVLATVDPHRLATMANHTATHLMNRALREVLGDGVDQKGSLVDPEKTRFDFSNSGPVTPEEVEEVERIVREDVAKNLSVYDLEVSLEEGQQIHGLRAVFGEKYPPKVRVVSIGVPVEDLLADPSREDWRSFSVEFCGGTHLKYAGNLGAFALMAEEGVAAGIRRVVACTGELADQAIQNGLKLEEEVVRVREMDDQALSGAWSELSRKVETESVSLVVRHRVRAACSEMSKRVKKVAREQAREGAREIVSQAREIASGSEGPVVVAVFEGAGKKDLRQAMDCIRGKRPEAAQLLASVHEGRIAFLATVPDPMIEKGLRAGDWVREVAQRTGGGGGGRPQMAEAGGKDISRLDEALSHGRKFALEALGVAP